MTMDLSTIKFVSARNHNEYTANELVNQPTFVNVSMMRRLADAIAVAGGPRYTIDEYYIGSKRVIEINSGTHIRLQVAYSTKGPREAMRQWAEDILIVTGNYSID